MRTCLLMTLICCSLTAQAWAAQAIELEIATERGLQITAPQEWLQLLTSIGLRNVRVRGASATDEPAVTNRGTPEQPRYHVVGILSAREQLRLPGGSFGRGDAKRLKEYFERLSAEGGERLIATTTLFGLTEQELLGVLTDLTQPLGMETKDQPPHAVLERLQSKLKYTISIEPAAAERLRTAGRVRDELSEISAGTAVAMMLRASELSLLPEKPRGQPVRYRVAPAASTTGISRATDVPGSLSDVALKTWPIGWKIDRSPGEAAPSLFEQLNAEIDGFTLAETLAAVGPRLKVPYFLDHATLAAAKLDPHTVQIKIPRTRISYKRLLDRVFSQAKLGVEIRADEAGKVFLWISK